MIHKPGMVRTRIALDKQRGPRQALRGGIQKSIFKHISGNLGSSRPKVDKSAPMAPRTHPRYPPEGPSVGRGLRLDDSTKSDPIAPPQLWPAPGNCTRKGGKESPKRLLQF